MTEQIVLRQLQQLPEEMKQEALDFIGYLWAKYNKQKEKKNLPQIGSAKGKYVMSDDFDAPLDVFKEYME